MTTLELLKVTKAVWGSIRDASPEEKNRILLAMADALQQETDSILAANEQDMDKAEYPRSCLTGSGSTLRASTAWRTVSEPP